MCQRFKTAKVIVEIRSPLDLSNFLNSRFRNFDRVTLRWRYLTLPFHMVGYKNLHLRQTRHHMSAIDFGGRGRHFCLDIGATAQCELF